MPSDEVKARRRPRGWFLAVQDEAIAGIRSGVAVHRIAASLCVDGRPVTTASLVHAMTLAGIDVCALRREARYAAAIARAVEIRNCAQAARESGVGSATLRAYLRREGLLTWERDLSAMARGLTAKGPAWLAQRARLGGLAKAAGTRRCTWENRWTALVSEMQRGGLSAEQARERAAAAMARTIR